jgi:hypothetical protein
MKYWILFVIAWIVNILLIWRTENYCASIFSMVCVGLVFIICLLIDIKKLFEKGAK